MRVQFGEIHTFCKIGKTAAGTSKLTADGPTRDFIAGYDRAPSGFQVTFVTQGCSPEAEVILSREGDVVETFFAPGQPESTQKKLLQEARVIQKRFDAQA